MTTSKLAAELVATANKTNADMVYFLLTNGWKQVEDGESVYGSWGKDFGDHTVIEQRFIDAVLYEAGQS